MGLIFAVPGHIEAIRRGEKTQTRRLWKPGMEMVCNKDTSEYEIRVNGRLLYEWGGVYAVLPGRGKKGVGFIEVTALRIEPMIRWEYPERPRGVAGTVAIFPIGHRVMISAADALAEGRYRPEEYECLWDRMYPNENRFQRLVIEFMWVGEER